MIREILHIRQIEGEPKRRWFMDDFFELLIWSGDDRDIVAFELYYNRFLGQHALSWRKGSGYTHYEVDDGEGRPGKMKASPILLPDGKFDHERIAERFKQESAVIEAYVSRFVYEKILQCPDCLEG